MKSHRQSLSYQLFFSVSLADVYHDREFGCRMRRGIMLSGVIDFFLMKVEKEEDRKDRVVLTLNGKVFGHY